MTVAGQYIATASLAWSAAWVLQVVAFKTKS